jgi:hypothetical protein
MIEWRLVLSDKSFAGIRKMRVVNAMTSGTRIKKTYFIAVASL